MTGIRQVGIRLKPEGGPAVVAEAKGVEAALTGMNNAAVTGSDRATAATQRTIEALKAEAGAARAAETALQRQINAATGVSGGANPVGQKYFQAESRVLDRRAAALLDELEPARAAQDRLNAELAEYDLLLKRNKITVDQHGLAQARARKRYDETTNALNRQTNGLTRNQQASRLNLMRQGADVFTTAAMGMSPHIIAIQQGPQIMDAWATSGIKAGGAMLAAAGAAAILVGAVAVMGAAWLSGEKSAVAYNKAVSGVGITAKMTAGQLRDAAMAGAEAANISIASAREQAVAYVSTGQIAGEVIEGIISLSKDYASFVGVDMKTATQQLAAAFSEPEKAARDMTRQFGLMDQETLKTIESLMKQGDRLAAQKILMDELTGSTAGHSSKVGELTNFWDAATRSLSDYWTKLGEYLYETDDEKMERLAKTANSQSLRGGKVDVSPHEREQARLELERMQRRKGVQAIADEFRADRLAANQEEQLRQDRKDKPKKGKSAEQLERERIARERREEDYQAGLSMQIARTHEDRFEIRRLEDEAAIRSRVRQLIDDGTAAEAARTKALQEQQPYLEARAQAFEAEQGRLTDAAKLEALKISGRTRDVADQERLADLERRILEYRDQGLDLTSETREVLNEHGDLVTEIVVTDHALLRGRRDILAIDEARLEVLRRSNEMAEREHEMNLARLSGNDELYRYLEIEDRIERRAREIEQRNKLNYGEGTDQAQSEIQEELNAEALGARKTWMRGLLSDIKSGGIGDAIANQLDRATDHWLNKLADSLAELDWGGFLQGLFSGLSGQGRGSGGGIWSSAFGALFGGGGKSGGDGFAQYGGPQNMGGTPTTPWWPFGGHAAGTEYSDGDWKWVGEKGPELFRMPRGGQVMDNHRSMIAAGSQKANGGLSIGTLQVVNNATEPVEASARMTPDGDLEILLKPLVDRSISQAGKSGHLARSMRQTPQTKRR